MHFSIVIYFKYLYYIYFYQAIQPAKMKNRNRADIRDLIDTLKFMGKLGIPFKGHRYSGHLEPISDIKDINTSTVNFRAK